jgi:phosphoesterase RecJ-like protein
MFDHMLWRPELNEWTDALDAFRSAQRVAITTHVRPDGDALGSCLGLQDLLRNNGIAADIVGVGPIADRYRFMLEGAEILDPEQTPSSDYDLLVVLDAGGLDRVDAFAENWIKSLKSINIDHHLKNAMFATINLVDTTACSVGEMIQRLSEEGNLPLTARGAEALWVALITDTGRFAYDNTSPRAMRSAAALLEHGIRTSEIDQIIYQRAPRKRLELEAMAMGKLQTAADGRIAYIALSQADFKSVDCTPADAEDLVNIPRRLDGVEVAMFLYEQDDGEVVKASVRSIPPHDAAAFCRTFNGGGHARAAGCTLDGTIPTAVPAFLASMCEAWFTA